MRTFDLGSTFDAVTCLFSSIGYVHYLVSEPGIGVRHFTDEHVMTLFATGEYEHALASAGLIGIGWVGVVTTDVTAFSPNAPTRR